MPTSNRLPTKVLQRIRPDASHAYVCDPNPHRPVPLAVIENLIRSGLIMPDELPLLGPVEHVPGGVIEATRLRWHPKLQQIVYVPPVADGHPWPNPEGFYRPLAEIRRALMGNPESCRWLCEDPLHPFRYSPELQAFLHIKPAEEYDVPGRRKPVTIPAKPQFVVQMDDDELVLTDLDYPRHVPVFDSIEEARTMADAAILNEVPLEWNVFASDPPRLRWLPLYRKPRN